MEKKAYNFTILLTYGKKTVKVTTMANGIDEDDARLNAVGNFTGIVRPDTEFDVISFKPV